MASFPGKPGLDSYPLIFLVLVDGKFYGLDDLPDAPWHQPPDASLFLHPLLYNWLIRVRVEKRPSKRCVFVCRAQLHKNHGQDNIILQNNSYHPIRLPFVHFCKVVLLWTESVILAFWCSTVQPEHLRKH